LILRSTDSADVVIYLIALLNSVCKLHKDCLNMKCVSVCE